MGRISGRGNSEENATVVTRLIPAMNFSCNVTIVSWIISANRNRQTGTLMPKIQIWRENGSLPDVYHKVNSAIAVNESVCFDDQSTPLFRNRVFLCILKDTARVSVQPGDILGLEIPPTNDDVFDIHFTNEGPVNYVFQQQLSYTVNLSNNDSEDREQPLISLQVSTGNFLHWWCIGFGL